MIKKNLQALYQSFYKPEIYREALFGWEGFGGRYFVVLSAVLAVMLTANFVVMVQLFKQNELPYLVDQIPAMTLNKNELSIDNGQAALIQNREKTFQITIDPSKLPSEMKETKTTMGIGKNFVTVRNRSGAYETYDMVNVKEKISLTKNIINKMISQIITIFSFLAFPLLWLGQFIDLIVECFIVAVFSYVVTAFLPEEYDFISRMRMSALALTLPEIISTFLKSAFNHDVQSWFILLLACLYIYVMIVLMRKLPEMQKPTAI